MDNLIWFALDQEAFQAWITPIHPEDLDISLPSKHSEYPSRDLSCLVCDAIEHGALVGDPRPRLTVYEGDDDESCGYSVVLHNEIGDQRMVGITSGWTELDFADPATTPADQAREYLTEVCAVANALLGFAARPPHVQGASMTNTDPWSPDFDEDWDFTTPGAYEAATKYYAGPVLLVRRLLLCRRPPNPASATRAPQGVDQSSAGRCLGRRSPHRYPNPAPRRLHTALVDSRRHCHHRRQLARLSPKTVAV